MIFQISRTVITVLVVDLLATSGDITQTWTSPMYPKLYSNDTTVNPLGQPIAKEEDSWIGSLINIGAVLGALPAGYLADKIGRKKLLIGIALPHITAYFMYAFAKNIYWFFIGRFVNGISLGAGYAILPMYIAEITEDSNRAVLSVTLNIFWTMGNFIPYAIGPYLSARTFNLVLAGIPCLFFVGFILIGTETPHYWVQIGEYSKAEETLMSLRSCGKSMAQKEVEELKEIFKRHEDGSLMDIFKNQGLRKALVISLTLLLLQQLSGVNAISYYLEPIFAASGSDFSASVSSTICGACMFIFSFSTPLFVGRFGKKWPLGISCFGSALSLAALGLFFYIKTDANLSTAHILWLPIAGLIGYIFFFNLALGPLPWTISSELFPNNVKSISASAVAVCCWLASFFITRFFNKLTEAAGEAGTFWIFSGCCLLALVFDVIWVPETQGKSFVQIQDMLQN